MELRKISKIMSMVCFLFYFTGCQNDFTEVMDIMHLWNSK